MSRRAETVPTTVAHPELGEYTVGLRRSGGPGGRRVLLVGGTGQPPESWDHVERALAAAGCEVVSLALRGVRPNDAPPGPWTVDDLGTDVLAVLDHLGWTEPVTLAGYSLGGFVVEQLARRTPGRVDHAVLVAGHRHASVFCRALYETRHAMEAASPEAARAFSRFATFTITLDPASHTRNEARARTWWEVMELSDAVWSAPHAAAAQSAAGADWVTGTHPPAEADHATRFTLVCFTDDLVIPAGPSARVAAAELGGCPVVELPGGHGALLTDPLPTAEGLVRVLTGGGPTG